MHSNTNQNNPRPDKESEAMNDSDTTKDLIDVEKEEQRELTEEELFLEEVLRAQEEALREEREQRLAGTYIKKRQPFTVKLVVWLMALALAFSTFAAIFQIYSIPAIEFLKTSAKLSSNADIQLYKKAVVEISTGDSKGTGFAFTSDGYILTNSHVVDDQKRLSVIFPEEGMMVGELVANFPEVDLAVVKVEGEKLPYLTLADTYDDVVNTHVQLIGNPLYFTGIANQGTSLEKIKTDLDVDVVMLDAPVYKGNSGSPVIDDAGNVIGVIYATTKSEQYGKVGLFIPIEAFIARFSQ